MMRSRLVAFLVLSSLTGTAPAADEGSEYFEKEIRPILVERCAECHGDKAKPKGGLRLDSREALLKGGESGPGAVVGKPDESLIIEAVRYSEEPKMPPKAKLKDREIAALTRWVGMGLPWPASKGAAPATAPAAFKISEEQRRFWSFQPLKDAPPPRVKDSAWVRSAIDQYILAGLEAKGLKPARAADKRTLLRRATFDLTGLPPTPEEVASFLSDQSPDAFSRAVDRLLASPQYGVRWGRHWLDVVRYTDSFDARGIGGEMDCADAWRYRDWVVSAFNRDLPYDQFVTRQIAGDLLPPPSPDGLNVDGVVATGMLAIGNWGGGDADKEKLLTDIADDQVDVVARAFLGLTVACARCHDHKFDPISTKDYYGLAGIFFSTHILPNVGPKTNGPPMLRIPLESPAEARRRTAYAGEVAEVEGRIKMTLDEEKARFVQRLFPETARYVVAAWEYQTRPPEKSGLPLADFAAGRKLHEFALRAWIGELGLTSNYATLSQPVRDLMGSPGVFAWKGTEDCPSLTVNTTTRPVRQLTYNLPPRSVSVHPGPNSGVVVGWKSPITGTVAISGRLVDGDPSCGDGVAWAIDLRQGRGVRELASGEFSNVGAQNFQQDPGAKSLERVEVRAGDLLQLVVLPKNGHNCDTTLIELKITRNDGPGAWDLAADVLARPDQGNPHADSLGHADVWRFEDTAGKTRSRTRISSVDSPLSQWKRTIAADNPSAAEIGVSADKIQQAYTKADARSPFWIKDEKDEGLLPAPGREVLTKLRGELDSLKKNPPPPPVFANGAQDGGVPGSPHAGVHDVKVHIRGTYSRLGDLVPRHFPVILAGEKQPAIVSGSGRLELARWLTRPDHLLTSRVMVNRIWQHHFGEGIVRTPSNFGKLGERPSHPELLDYLARQFAAGGWSIKKMHRAIMLSAAYQQSSEPEVETGKADPDNRLFGRMKRRRLESEAIRDTLLAVSGKLDLTTGGPSIRDFNTPRRSIYLTTIRSDRSSFGPLFDVADATAMVDKRAVSTVAPQALFLLNNPFVLDQAQALARRVLKEGDDDGARIDRAYALLYGRAPTPDERRIGLESVATPGNDLKSRELAWESYCQILLCANELIYID